MAEPSPMKTKRPSRRRRLRPVEPPAPAPPSLAAPGNVANDEAWMAFFLTAPLEELHKLERAILG